MTVPASGLCDAAHVSRISRGEWSGDTILHDKVSASDVEVMKGFELTEFHGDQRVTGLSVRRHDNGEGFRLEVDGVFIEVGTGRRFLPGPSDLMPQ